MNDEERLRLRDWYRSPPLQPSAKTGDMRVILVWQALPIRPCTRFADQAFISMRKPSIVMPALVVALVGCQSNSRPGTDTRGPPISGLGLDLASLKMFVEIVSPGRHMPPMSGCGDASPALLKALELGRCCVQIMTMRVGADGWAVMSARVVFGLLAHCPAHPSLPAPSAGYR